MLLLSQTIDGHRVTKRHRTAIAIGPRPTQSHPHIILSASSLLLKPKLSRSCSNHDPSRFEQPILRIHRRHDVRTPPTRSIQVASQYSDWHGPSQCVNGDELGHEPRPAGLGSSGLLLGQPSLLRNDEAPITLSTRLRT